MARRLLSHLLITLAIFSLSLTFLIWVLDAAVLNSTNLTKALRQGGVPSAIANVIPEQAASNDKECNNDQQNQMNQMDQMSQPQNGGCQPKTEQDKQDEADMRAKIAAVVTPTYVDEKLQSVTTSMITFIKNGEPKPVIDLSDFPDKLRASGVEVGDDISKNFDKPVELSNDKLAAIPKAYKLLKLAKYLAILLCVVLLVAEYFAAAKGNRMHLIGRIFLHVGFWYTVWWGALIIVPSLVLPKLKEKANVDASINTLIDAISKSMQHLLARYFLAFAIVCWVIAITLYLVRHARKHVDKIQAVPVAKRGNTTPTPNKR